MIFTSLNKRILTVINDKDRFLNTVAIAITDNIAIITVSAITYIVNDISVTPF